MLSLACSVKECAVQPEEKTNRWGTQRGKVQGVNNLVVRPLENKEIFARPETHESRTRKWPRKETVKERGDGKPGHGKCKNRHREVECSGS